MIPYELILFDVVCHVAQFSSAAVVMYCMDVLAVHMYILSWIMDTICGMTHGKLCDPLVHGVYGVQLMLRICVCCVYSIVIVYEMSLHVSCAKGTLYVTHGGSCQSHKMLMPSVHATLCITCCRFCKSCCLRHVAYNV